MPILQEKRKYLTKVEDISVYEGGAHGKVCGKLLEK